MFQQIAIPISRSTQFFCWVYNDAGMFWFLEKDLQALLGYHPEQVLRIPENWCKKNDICGSLQEDDFIVNEWGFYFLIHQCASGIPLQKWLNDYLKCDETSLMRPLPGEKVFIHELLEGFVEFAKNLKLEWMTQAPASRYVFLLLKEKQPKHLKFAYRVLRCQKRYLWNALKWLNPNEFEPILYRENFVHAQSILSTCKLAMLHDGIMYGATCNRIESNDDRVEWYFDNFINQYIIPKTLIPLMQYLSESYPKEWYRLCSQWNPQHEYSLRSCKNAVK